MKDHQRLALERGLVEFDRVVARRRVRRRAAGIALVLAVLAGAGVLAPRLGTTGWHRPLPSCVEVIASDAQLTDELELASACERIGRREGRIYVVECTRPAR